MEVTKHKKFFKATNDIVFKAVFLPPNNWNLVKRLIEDATKLTDIEIVSVVSPELPKDNIYNKGKTLDVVVKTKDRIFSIEVNVYDEIIFHRRSFAYIASQYANDLNAGDDYEVMKDHIQINISVSRSSEIPAYDIVGDGSIGGMAYYTSENCGYVNDSWVGTNCTTSYNSSEIKYVIDSWATTMFKNSELKTVDGYSARLI